MTDQSSTVTLLQQPPLDTEGSSSAEIVTKKTRKKDKNDLSRGIETMFRVTYQNHIQLSQLADGKAGILISVNGVIISVVIALIAPRIQSMGTELLPAMVLLMGGMISLAFAIISSRPRINASKVSLEDVRANRSSILFFGHFNSMPLDDFETGMHELMESRQLLYNNLIREIYSMGRVLTKKYHYLNTAYLTFLGTITTAGTLLIVLILLESYMPRPGI